MTYRDCVLYEQGASNIFATRINDTSNVLIGRTKDTSNSVDRVDLRLTELEGTDESSNRVELFLKNSS